MMHSASWPTLIMQRDNGSALAAIEQLPEIYFTKLTEMAFLLTGKPKLEAAEKQNGFLLKICCKLMIKLRSIMRKRVILQQHYQK